MKKFFSALFVLSTLLTKAQAPSNGLLHHYPFNGSLANSVGSHTLAGGTGSYVNDRFGNTKRAHNVAAANGHFTSAGIPNLPSASAAPRSFAFWYQSNSNVNHALFAYGDAAAYYGVYYLTSPSPRLVVVSGTGSTPIGQLTPISYNTTYTGNWTHVAVVYTGTQIKLYVNGVNVSSANFGLYTMSNTASYIGVYAAGSLANNFKMDDLFFYDRALTDQEVTSVFNACSGPTNTTPLANTGVCNGQTTTLSAIGNNITWYEVSTGGTAVATGNSFTTPVLTNNAVYYAQTSTCTARFGQTITVNPTPAAPVNTTTNANQNIICGATATLTATGSNLLWFDAPTSGNLVGNGGSFTTPALTTNTSYYVQASSGGCNSARTQVAVTVTNPAPTAVNSSVNYCYIDGSNNFTVLQVAAGPGTVSWYNVPTGGTALGTGNNFTTPSFANPSPNASYTLNYYAERTTPCGASARTMFTITVKKRPAAPTSTTPSANLNICSGSTTTLSATTNAPAIEWYPTVGFPSVLSNTNSYTTPALTQTTSYDVFAVENGCSSNPALTLTVNVSTPTTPTNTTSSAYLTVCSGSSTTLSASGSGTLYWFDAPTGGNQLASGDTFNTPGLTANTTYYVQSGNGSCASSRTAIAVAVMQAPAAPVSNTPAANLRVCQGSGTTLSVQQPSSGISTSWWASPSAVSPYSVGVSLSVPASSLQSTSTFYVRHVDMNNGCGSAFTPITVIVDTTPASPTNTTPSANLTVCQGQNTTLTVSGTDTIQWFDSPTGGNLLATGSPYATPVLQNVTTFYVSAKRGNCISPRTAIQVQVNGAPNSPTNTTPTANRTRCAGQATTLTATSGVANASIKWYNVASGGSPLGTGGSFATQALTADTTFYVAVVSNITGCSSIRVPITITVNPAPTVTISPASVSICSGQSATLTASGGGTYAWSNSGGNNASATVSPTSNTTYTVTVTTNGCTATASRAVTVNQNPTASITPASPAICNGQSQTLTASGGGTYAWSNGLGSGATKSVSPTATTTYTVTVTNAANCTATATSTLTVNSVNASINGPTTICSGLNATLTASGGGTYAWSNSGGTNAQATFTPTATTTYTVTVTGAGGCTATASQTVSVQSAPTASISGATSVCAGGSVTLTANGGNTYTWANGLGTNAAITVSPTATTTYTVTVSIGANCTASASKTVTILQPSSGSFSETICFGDSYTFNGQQLTQSGVYYDTLTNAGGCDSIVTLNLTVQNKVSSTVSAQVCNGQSYTFNGQQLTQAGQYFDTLQTVLGCDSFITLNLTVFNKIETTVNAGICNGQSYTFNGQQLTQAGQYFDTLQTVLGCDSFVTLNLAVNSFVTGSTSASICAGDSYTFNGQQLTQGGQYMDTLVSSGGCDSIVTLTLTVNQLPQPTITQNGNMLSTQVFASYQWQFNGSDISNAT
ncbi:MAG: LamG-like jellyroll fold domain-containing protein, partial [Chitinophagales bacterium]